MNKWQMDGRTLTWPNGGGRAIDNKGWSHASIHPHGRNDNHRRKQSNRRSRIGGQ
jgi:hypothetical protein